MSGRCQAHHLEAIGGRDARALAVWRHAGRHPAHFGQVEGLARLLGQAQVADMHRVEGAAEHRQRPGRAAHGGAHGSLLTKMSR